jgi:polysaccharide export outer membrane protein
MKQLYRNLLVVWFVVTITGCASSPPNLPAEPEAGSGAGPSVLVDAYKMSIGDEVQVSVWKNPELSVTVPIRPDGKITVPLVGDVVAAGREPEELAADISGKLGNYIKNPNVTVILGSLQGHAFLSRIRVTGSVLRDASMPYQQGMTVLDAVLEAGSVDIYADSNRTKVHRRTTDGAESYDIRLKDIMEDGDMTTNILLLPGDIVSVPERNF